MQPEVLLLMVMLSAITLYAVLGGADFGAGVWEFTSGLQSTAKERNHVYRAIGPVWEANHVWLIFVMVILMNGFPVVFAGVSRALWFPLLMAVWGILFRGAAYAFRSHSHGPQREKRIWEMMFAVASTAAPLFLGAAAGAIASGELALTAEGKYSADYVSDWMTPLSIFTGFYTVGLCAYLSSVYLVREAHVAGDSELTVLWRNRAVSTGLWMGVLSLAGLVLVAREVPLLAEGFSRRGWPLILASLACGSGGLIQVLRSKYTSAMLLSSGAVAAVIWGWGVSQFPTMVPPNIQADAAAAPDHILWMMLAVIFIGTLIMLPALGYLFWLFKSKPSA